MCARAGASAGPASTQQLPLLLRMGELPLALEKAAHSANVELVHVVLLHAKTTLAEAEFYELLLPQVRGPLHDPLVRP